MEAEGIKVYTYVDDELAGMAAPMDSLYFLTIQSDRVGELRFETEDGTVLRTSLTEGTPSLGTYLPDSHFGTPENPIVLKPVEEDRPYKIIENNHVIIIRNNEKYDITGKKL